jgi:lipopolysaccharide transport system ATP-binding protein
MSEYLIRIEGLSKKYCKDLKKSLWYGIEDSSREIFGISRNHELRSNEFWALQDINLQLKRGECLGLIGQNGAGKSTLLKILNGIIKPDKGKVIMRGRVAAIIELGAGFNPALTGKENIYANGAILGMRKTEIDKLYDSIVDFSELDAFINTPVRFYSSGMRVRLGFSVAIHLKPDVLLLDEVLAVGDMGFRIKSLNAMASLIKETAVIFVSHSVDQIARISNKICLLEQGKSVYIGEDISNGILQYENSGIHGSLEYVHQNLVSVAGYHINNTPLKKVHTFPFIFGHNLDILFDLHLDDSIDNFSIKVEFADKNNRLIAHYHSLQNRSAFKNTNLNSTCKLHVLNLNFADGVYFVHLIIMDGEGILQYYCRRNLCKLQVSGSGHAVKGFSSILLNGDTGVINEVKTISQKT